MTIPSTDKEQQMGRLVHDWLRDDAEFVPERAQRIGQVMDEVHATKQRRRWWPLIPFGGRAVHSASRDAETPRPVAPALVSLAVVVFTAAALLYAAGLTPTLPIGGPGANPELAAATTLMDRSAAAWTNSDRALLEEVYAQDAIHRVIYHDRVTSIEGVDEIAVVALGAGPPIGRVGDVVTLPSPAGEQRYLAMNDMWGGMGCVFTVVDGRINRHECVAPKAYNDYATFTPGVDDSDDGLLLAEDFDLRRYEAWNDDDQSKLEQAYSTDAVATSLYLDDAVVSEGVDEIADLARSITAPISPVAPVVELPAPEGELRWISVSDRGGGTVCSMWATRGTDPGSSAQIVRQDCLVPSSSPIS